MNFSSLAPSRGPWNISLAPHIYSSFMQHCPDSLLRWNVWKAYRSRGSPGQNKDLTTSLHLEEIRFARRDQVKLLGYASFADMSMETKMAGSVKTVKNMINSLAELGNSIFIIFFVILIIYLNFWYSLSAAPKRDCRSTKFRSYQRI